MVIEHERLKSLFLAAIELPDRAAQLAYVVEQAGSDPELRQRLEEMLGAHANPSPVVENSWIAGAMDALASGSFAPPDPLPGPAEQVGQIIAGRFKLLEPLGEGGMGTVWVAEQLEPVRRRVALKLIKSGLDSQHLLARFEIERQALAVMDHPHIAKVLDGGLTDSGRPFFVMEYAQGLAITRYCDACRLSIDERLKLFVTVCQAVQHAHQKGILHRDLKPANILVGAVDGVPVPKVIDFGLAKAIGQPLSEQGDFTVFGAMLGTPMYMSPEQAETNNLDIDTRSDVYSLGVVLYELLTGTTPWDRKEFRRAVWQEMMRLIKEQDPPRPSARLSSSDLLPSVAAQRHIEPHQLTRLVQGELDWIVMKSLEKDRDRRYESANSFAADISRYLASEPVAAHPPSWAYRLRKFARRNRLAVLAASLIALALLAGLVGLIYGLLQADARRRIAQQSARTEKQLREKAEQRLEQLAANNQVLGSIFRDLDVRQIDETGENLKVVLGERLKAAAAKIRQESVGDSQTVADLQLTLAESLQGLAFFAEAIDLASQARATYARLRGSDHRDTLHAMRTLATALHDNSELDKAVPLYQETLALRKATLGPNHPDSLQSMADLAAGYRANGKLPEAVLLFEEAVTAMKEHLGPRHADTLATMSRLAIAHQLSGNLDKALPLYEEAHRLTLESLGPEHPESIKAASILAFGLRAANQFERALAIYEATLAKTTTSLGPTHPESLRILVSLGGVHQAMGNYDEAITRYGEALKLLKERLGLHHPYTMSCLASLGNCYTFAGKPELALPYLEQMLQIRTSKLGPDHPDTLASMTDLAWGYQGVENDERALLLFQQVAELSKKKFGVDHPATLMSVCEYALALTENGQAQPAIVLFRETVARMKARHGLQFPDTLYCMGCMAIAYKEAGQFDLAQSTLLEVAEHADAVFGFNSVDSLRIKANLAEVYRLNGKLDQALELAEPTYVAHKEKLGSTHPDTLVSLSCLARCLHDAAQYADAEILLREALANRQALAPQAKGTFEIRVLLARSLLEQKKLEEAETLLSLAIDNLNSLAKSTRDRSAVPLNQVLDRLIEIYAESSQTEKLEKWRAEKNKLPGAAEKEK